MSGVNVPLLRKAVEWAEAEASKPREQSQWYQGATVMPAAAIGRNAECGTCYCIAGYVASVETGLEDPYERPEDDAGGVMEYAANVLGLDPIEATDGLFHADNTIEDVRRIAEDLAGERL